MRIQPIHVLLVRQLARQQVSQRHISQQVGISRDSVRRILRGQVSLSNRPKKCDGLPPPPNWRTPARRCPQCGGLVHMPCLACELRRYLSARQGSIDVEIERMNSRSA
jgi:hypothetical protein